MFGNILWTLKHRWLSRKLDRQLEAIDRSLCLSRLFGNKLPLDPEFERVFTRHFLILPMERQKARTKEVIQHIYLTDPSSTRKKLLIKVTLEELGKLTDQYPPEVVYNSLLTKYAPTQK